MNERTLQDIGRRIQNRRKQLGYTQEQLADEMDVSIQMVSNLERGNKAIRIDNLVNLSRILEVSTDYILTGNESGGDSVGLVARIEALSPNSRRMIEVLVEHCLSEKL